MAPLDTGVVKFLTLLGLLLLTGSFFGFIVAVLVSWLVGFLYQKFAVGRLPAPANGAVIITGCSSGIGHDAALHLASMGLKVFAGVRKDADAEKLKREHKNLIPLILDVAKQEDIDKAVVFVRERVAKDKLKLIGLVNNAGYNESSVMELVPLDKLRKQFDVNVFAQVAMTQAFLPLLREFGDQAHHPRVVFVASGFGHITFPLVGPYAATKHAIVSIGEAFRMELQSWGIRVVVVSPGAIKTHFMDVTKDNHKENVLKEEEKGGEVVKSYAKRSSELMAKQIVMEKLNSTTKVTNEALEASLLDTEPLFEYFPGMDSSFGVPVVTSLPTIFMDRVFGRFFR